MKGKLTAVDRAAVKQNITMPMARISRRMNARSVGINGRYEKERG